jgi:hypothetical protein
MGLAFAGRGSGSAGERRGRGVDRSFLYIETRPSSNSKSFFLYGY